MLWQERYSLDPAAVPNFIDNLLATKILTIGKSINFLRRLCGDSEWIMGPMAKVRVHMLPERSQSTKFDHLSCPLEKIRYRS